MNANINESYKKAASSQGFEVVADPSGESDYFIFRSKFAVEDSSLCDTQEEAWKLACIHNDLKVDFALDEFTRGYIAAALFSSLSEDDTPLDRNFGPEDLQYDSMEKIISDCDAFQSAHANDLKEAYGKYEVTSEFTATSLAGMDFWYSRNGHGVGFWDRGLGEVGDRLSDAASATKEATVEVDVDNTLTYAGSAKPKAKLSM